jgi:hypothetical protein
MNNLKQSVEDFVEYTRTWSISEKELKEITLKADLDKAINYYVEYASINELKEQFDWYKVNNIYMLKSVMFESYLDNYNEEELKERIKMLYE